MLSHQSSDDNEGQAGGKYKVPSHEPCPEVQAGGDRLFLCIELDEDQNLQLASLPSSLFCHKHAFQTVLQTLATCSLCVFWVLSTGRGMMLPGVLHLPQFLLTDQAAGETQ